MVGMAVDLAALPYRCPKCEQNADFPTLEGLRRHLAIDHSYGNSTLRHRRNQTTRPSAESSGRVSPLTESFIRQRQLLEEQLRLAQLRESQSRSVTPKSSTQSVPDPTKIYLNSRLRSASYSGTYKSDQSRHDVTSLRHTLPSREHDVKSREPEVTAREHVSLYNRTRRRHSPPQAPVTSANDPPQAPIPSPNDPITVDDLYSNEQPRRVPRRQGRRTKDDVTLGTFRWDLSDALAKTRDHVDSMKQTADSVVHHQAALIELLRQELKAKDERLDDVRKQLAILHGDRRKMLTKVARLNRDQDQSADSIAKLTAKVQDKDRSIHEKEREVEELSSYLRGASEEERAAQAHLEAYITTLTTRAERAETALTALGTSPEPHPAGLQDHQPSAAGLHRSGSPATDTPPHVSRQLFLPQGTVGAPATPTISSSPSANQGAARTPRDQTDEEANNQQYTHVNGSKSAVSDITKSHRRVASWGPDSVDGATYFVPIDVQQSASRSLPIPVASTYPRRGGPPPTRLDRARRKWEALTCVFRFLDTASLSRMSLVCREWRDVSRQPALWRKVCLQRAALSSRFLRTISQWCTQLQSLTLEGISGRNRRPNETAEQYKKAVRGSLEAGLEALLTGAGDSLRSLRVVDCGHVLTDRCLWLASCHCRLLQRVAYVSDTDPPGSEVIWALGAGCRDIQTLIIPPKYPNSHPSRFTDRCLTMTAACWPQLLVLCIGGVEVTSKGLTAIAKSCSRLQVLELDHLCEVTEDVAVSMCRHGLRGLLTLEFASTPVTPRALLHFVSSCASLQSVRIHLSVADYFKDTSDAENQRQYRDVISKLQLVRSRPGMSEIIYIRDTS